MHSFQTLTQPFFSHPSSSPASTPSTTSNPPASASSVSSLESTSSPYNHQSKETRPNDAFHTLVSDLSNVLGPSSGLDSEDVDPKDIMRLMEEYTSQEAEWKQYAFADGSRGYTRNLVDEGNGKSNLLILVWSPGKGSAVHDHANAHCVMKILKGRLQETLYDWPEEDKVSHGEKSPLNVKRVTTLGENQVAYMSDQLGLHKIINPDPSDFAVSLHLYTPPHAAHFGFSIFDPKTGKSSHIPHAPVYSDKGKKV